MPLKSSLYDLLRNGPPQGTWQTFADVLVAANVTARRLCAGLDSPEKRDTFGHVQRGFIETMLRERLGGVDGVECDVRSNAAGTSSFTEVRTGKMLITQSAVTDRSSMPRNALFRNELSDQLNFFEKQRDPDTVYAIVIHAYDKAYIPRYLEVRVPSKDCTKFLARLNLDEQLVLALQREGIDGLVGTATEPTAPPETIAEPNPMPKKNANRKRAEGETG